MASRILSHVSSVLASSTKINSNERDSLFRACRTCCASGRTFASSLKTGTMIAMAAGTRRSVVRHPPGRKAKRGSRTLPWQSGASRPELWFAATFHLDGLVAETPADVDSRLRRTNAHEQLAMDNL